MSNIFRGSLYIVVIWQWWENFQNTAFVSRSANLLLAAFQDWVLHLPFHQPSTLSCCLCQMCQQSLNTHTHTRLSGYSDGSKAVCERLHGVSSHSLSITISLAPHWLELFKEWRERERERESRDFLCSLSEGDFGDGAKSLCGSQASQRNLWTHRNKTWSHTLIDARDTHGTQISLE